MRVGDLLSGALVSVGGADSLRGAASTMQAHTVGSAVVLTQETLSGIVTERDILRAVASGTDLDQTAVEAVMTRDVVTVGPDWEVYEAAAEMAARHIRHLVVESDGKVIGVLSIRDVLLSGQRLDLGEGRWAVLRDPLTFTIRERRRLQRALLDVRHGPGQDDVVDELVTLLVGSWSFDVPVASGAEALQAIGEPDREQLRRAVIGELPDLQRAVHPAPGWRRRT